MSPLHTLNGDNDNGEQPAGGVSLTPSSGLPADVTLTPPLTIAGVKLRIDKTLAGDDVLLADMLNAAFLQAQAPPPYGCGRNLVPDPATDDTEPVTRRLRAVTRDVWVPDAREITAITVNGADIDLQADGLEVLDLHGHIVRVTLPTLLPGATVDVTGRFGFRTIPQNLAEAIYTLAARMFHERDAAYADQVAFAEGAEVQSYYRQLPPRTKLAFASYTIPAGLVRLS